MLSLAVSQAEGPVSFGWDRRSYFCAGRFGYSQSVRALHDCQRA